MQEAIAHKERTGTAVTVRSMDKTVRGETNMGNFSSARSQKQGKSAVLPQLKYVNDWQLVVMGVEIPLTRAQAHQVFAQLQQGVEV